MIDAFFADVLAFVDDELRKDVLLIKAGCDSRRFCRNFFGGGHNYSRLLIFLVYRKTATDRKKNRIKPLYDKPALMLKKPPIAKKFGGRHRCLDSLTSAVARLDLDAVVFERHASKDKIVRGIIHGECTANGTDISLPMSFSADQLEK